MLAVRLNSRVAPDGVVVRFARATSAKRRRNAGSKCHQADGRILWTASEHTTAPVRTAACRTARPRVAAAGTKPAGSAARRPPQTCVEIGAA